MLSELRYIKQFHGRWKKIFNLSYSLKCLRKKIYVFLTFFSCADIDFANDVSTF